MKRSLAVALLGLVVFIIAFGALVLIGPAGQGGVMVPP